MLFEIWIANCFEILGVVATLAANHIRTPVGSNIGLYVSRSSKLAQRPNCNPIELCSPCSQQRDVRSHFITDVS